MQFSILVENKKATYCFSNIPKRPLDVSTDTQCPQAAQRKQAKRAVYGKLGVYVKYVYVFVIEIYNCLIMRYHGSLLGSMRQCLRSLVTLAIPECI